VCFVGVVGVSTVASQCPWVATSFRKLLLKKYRPQLQRNVTYASGIFFRDSCFFLGYEIALMRHTLLALNFALGSVALPRCATLALVRSDTAFCGVGF
jgi:hypothetical protein